MQACKIISILTYYIIDSWYGYIQSPVISGRLWGVTMTGSFPGISQFPASAGFSLFIPVFKKGILKLCIDSVCPKKTIGGEGERILKERGRGGLEWYVLRSARREGYMAVTPEIVANRGVSMMVFSQVIFRVLFCVAGCLVGLGRDVRFMSFQISRSRCFTARLDFLMWFR